VAFKHVQGPLHPAICLDNQEVEFKIMNPPNKKLEQNNETIVDFEQLEINPILKKKTKEDSLFVEFISNPDDFMNKKNRDSDGEQQMFKMFSSFYKMYKINNFDCRELDDILVSKLDQSKHPQVIKILNDISFKRKLVNEKEAMDLFQHHYDSILFSDSLSDQIEFQIRKIKKIEPKSSRIEILSIVFKELFEEWKRGQSKFHKELDGKLLNDSLKQKVKKEILELIKSKGISDFDFSVVFSEVEQKLIFIDEYFNKSNISKSSLKKFIDLKVENEKIKLEIEFMKQSYEEEILKLKNEINSLKGIEYVPHDAVFIEYE
jgi:hypothetical protein